MTNTDAMGALMSMEGFRNLNQEIETIIDKHAGKDVGLFDTVHRAEEFNPLLQEVTEHA